MQSKPYQLRAAAAQVILQVLDEKKFLTLSLPHFKANVAAKDQSLLQEICYGVLRTLPKLECCLAGLLVRPLSSKQRIVHHLLLVGLYQLQYTAIPAYAAIAETVQAAVIVERSGLKNVVNAVLRRFQREQIKRWQQVEQAEAHFLHPAWLLEKIQQYYPTKWQQVVEANNQHPPMWLRVNLRHHTGTQYLQLLQQVGLAAYLHPQHASAIRLALPCAVENLPGFAQGWVSVQDLSAQYCVEYLLAQPGDRVADLCAAPGGKGCALLEAVPDVRLTSVDVDPYRLKQLKENLARLQLNAQVICSDVCRPEKWLQSDELFDKIILDVPCSATGIIRRHPEIKWLRRPEEITTLLVLQQQLMSAAWQCLKPGGVMLYVTCSILVEENHQQIIHFLSKQQDAQQLPLTSETIEEQIIPNQLGGDGFFYAKLLKLALAPSIA